MTPLADLTLHEGCQARTRLTEEAVEAYAAAYANGGGLPAIEVFDVTGELVVVDGFHRVEAAKRAGRESVQVQTVGSGTLEEAEWVALTKNHSHGVRRTQSDKRKAVRMALDNGIGAKLSNRKLAKHLEVSHTFVAIERSRGGNVATDAREIIEEAAKDPESFGELITLIDDSHEKEDGDTPISYRPEYDGDEWYTPAKYIEAAREVMGGIDLDPASNLTAQQTVKAARFFTKDDDGLSQPWKGRVFNNPPYSHPLGTQFANKLCDELEAGNIEAGVFLQNASTDTSWFHRLAPYCLLCFPNKRIAFLTPDGIESKNNRYGQIFFYYGPDRERFAEVFGAFGLVVTPERRAA